MPNITGSAVAGFQDASLWEEAKKMIDKALENTSITVVCVTYGTSTRKYINYEIDQSLAKGNGLVAVQIHHLKDPNHPAGTAGAIPSQIEPNGCKAYQYSHKEALTRWIEEAANLAGQ